MEWDGYNGGEIASSLATISAKNYIEDNFKNIKPENDNMEETDAYSNMEMIEDRDFTPIVAPERNDNNIVQIEEYDKENINCEPATEIEEIELL